MKKIFLLGLLSIAAACSSDDDAAHAVTVKINGEQKNFDLIASQLSTATDPGGNTVVIAYFDTEEDTKTDHQDHVEFSVYKEGAYKNQIHYFRYLDQGPNLAYLASISPNFSVIITKLDDHLIKGKFSGIIKSGDLSKDIENGKINIEF